MMIMIIVVLVVVLLLLLLRMIMIMMNTIIIIGAWGGWASHVFVNNAIQMTKTYGRSLKYEMISSVLYNMYVYIYIYICTYIHTCILAGAWGGCVAHLAIHISTTRTTIMMIMIMMGNPEVGVGDNFWGSYIIIGAWGGWASHIWVDSAGASELGRRLVRPFITSLSFIYTHMYIYIYTPIYYYYYCYHYYYH